MHDIIFFIPTFRVYHIREPLGMMGNATDSWNGSDVNLEIYWVFEEVPREMTWEYSSDVALVYILQDPNCNLNFEAFTDNVGLGKKKKKASLFRQFR